MTRYEIEAHGGVREVYIVEAESEEVAVAKWECGEAGDPVISEVVGVDIVSIREAE